nr:AraC family transcriptional regulator [Kribbella italica]
MLADVVSIGGVHGTVGARIEGAEPWALQWPDRPSAGFYALTSGTALLGVAGREPLRLQCGDVVLLPSGLRHVIGSHRGAMTPAYDPIALEAAQRRGEILQVGTGEVTARILAATYSQDPVVSTQVLARLPEVVHLRSASLGNSVDESVSLLARELAEPQLGSAIVLNRVVDVLLVQLLRVWLATRPEAARRTWLGVLGDPLLTTAVTLLHTDPARRWTTELLAAELGVSRATLTRRFVGTTGRGPSAYLTHWRTDLAARRLRDTDDTLESIARSVGYASGRAFSRAFSQIRGQSPGRFRTESRSTLPRMDRALVSD